jgi:hypothetical protein
MDAWGWVPDPFRFSSALRRSSDVSLGVVLSVFNVYPPSGGIMRDRLLYDRCSHNSSCAFYHNIKWMSETFAKIKKNYVSIECY